MGLAVKIPEGDLIRGRVGTVGYMGECGCGPSPSAPLGAALTSNRAAVGSGGSWGEASERKEVARKGPESSATPAVTKQDAKWSPASLPCPQPLIPHAYSGTIVLRATGKRLGAPSGPLESPLQSRTSPGFLLPHTHMPAHPRRWGLRKALGAGDVVLCQQHLPRILCVVLLLEDPFQIACHLGACRLRRS
ncbi:hypothetical protein GH733_001200 [Mirounga leonina]|nr:hypothetical protein GH733_001200 [Mirounga leonina]